MSPDWLWLQSHSLAVLRLQPTPPHPRGSTGALRTGCSQGVLSPRVGNRRPELTSGVKGPNFCQRRSTPSPVSLLPVWGSLGVTAFLPGSCGAIGGVWGPPAAGEGPGQPDLVPQQQHTQPSFWFFLAVHPALTPLLSLPVLPDLLQSVMCNVPRPHFPPQRKGSLFSFILQFWPHIASAAERRHLRIHIDTEQASPQSPRHWPQPLGVSDVTTHPRRRVSAGQETLVCCELQLMKTQTLKKTLKASSIVWAP